jgi:hypothetical protein
VSVKAGKTHLPSSYGRKGLCVFSVAETIDTPYKYK